MSRLVLLKTEKDRIIAVTFDLWETLLYEKDGANLQRTAARCRNVAAVLNRFGVRSNSEQVDLAIRTATSTLVAMWDKNKDVAHRDQLKLIIQAIPPAAAKSSESLLDQLSAALISPVFEVRPYLNPEAQSVLQKLKEREKSIALICNTGLTPGTGLRELLAEFHVAEYFDLMIFSEEIGIRKPDREIFSLAARGLKVKACEAVHVGDNLKSDVWGAKNAGFKSAYLSSEEGHDKTAEADPNSLLSLSRKLGGPVTGKVHPDRTLHSLSALVKLVDEL